MPYDTFAIRGREEETDILDNDITVTVIQLACEIRVYYFITTHTFMTNIVLFEDQSSIGKQAL